MIQIDINESAQRRKWSTKPWLFVWPYFKRVNSNTCKLTICQFSMFYLCSIFGKLWYTLINMIIQTWHFNGLWLRYVCLLDLFSDTSSLSQTWPVPDLTSPWPDQSDSWRTYFIQGSNRFWKACDKDIWHNDKNNIRIISMQKPYFLRL